MKRKDLIPYLETKLQETNLFKTIFKYIAPPHNMVQSYPAIAMTFNETKIDNTNIHRCNIQDRRRDVYLNIVVYNKALNKNIKNYEDSLSELLEEVEVVINNMLKEDEGIIDAEVVKIKDDEGLIYPHQVALILIKFRI